MPTFNVSAAADWEPTGSVTVRAPGKVNLFLGVGDRRDDGRPEALQRAEDLGGVEEQISRVTWLLAGGNPTGEGQLPNGTAFKLRFSDGEEVDMRVVNFIEETPAGAEDSTLTADSPLGLALYGHKAGDTITYQTPRGELQVTLLAIEQP